MNGMTYTEQWQLKPASPSRKDWDRSHSLDTQVLVRRASAWLFTPVHLLAFGTFRSNAERHAFYVHDIVGDDGCDLSRVLLLVTSIHFFFISL